MTPAEVRASIADAFAEVREYVAARPLEFRVGWSAAFAVAVSLVVTPFELWVWVLFADTLAAAMGLGAWVYRLRGERDSARSSVRDLNAEATRLHLLLTEAEIAAPVPYVPVVAPRLRIVEQLRPTHDDLTNADDAIWLNLYDENGQHR